MLNVRTAALFCFIWLALSRPCLSAQFEIEVSLHEYATLKEGEAINIVRKMQEILCREWKSAAKCEPNRGERETSKCPISISASGPISSFQKINATGSRRREFTSNEIKELLQNDLNDERVAKIRFRVVTTISGCPVKQGPQIHGNILGCTQPGSVPLTGTAFVSTAVLPGRPHDVAWIEANALIWVHELGHLIQLDDRQDKQSKEYLMFQYRGGHKVSTEEAKEFEKPGTLFPAPRL